MTTDQETVDIPTKPVQPSSTDRGKEAFVFQDAKGRKWDIHLSLAAAYRIDNSDFSNITQRKFSILKPSRELFMDIMTDTPLLFAMIWAIVQPQVKDQLRIDPQTDPDTAEIITGLIRNIQVFCRIRLSETDFIEPAA